MLRLLLLAGAGYAAYRYYKRHDKPAPQPRISSSRDQLVWEA